MNIALIGYGKMGKAIEKIALEKGHQISHKIASQNKNDLFTLSPKNVDVAIEFTQPEAAFENIKYCLENNIPVICGTTGWLKEKNILIEICKKNNGAFLSASNFSVGVNLFFQLNKWLAQLMQSHQNYKISLEEIHHTEKKDSPSGTAITLAQGIIENNSHKKNWVNHTTDNQQEIPIISQRMPHVPGTHLVQYNSPIDTIEIKHTAHTRDGFARGAVLAAEWLKDKKGIFTMDDVLDLGKLLKL